MDCDALSSVWLCLSQWIKAKWWTWDWLEAEGQTIVVENTEIRLNKPWWWWCVLWRLLWDYGDLWCWQQPFKRLSVWHCMVPAGKQLQSWGLHYLKPSQGPSLSAAGEDGFLKPDPLISNFYSFFPEFLQESRCSWGSWTKLIQRKTGFPTCILLHPCWLLISTQREITGQCLHWWRCSSLVYKA